MKLARTVLLATLLSAFCVAAHATKVADVGEEEADRDLAQARMDLAVAADSFRMQMERRPLTSDMKITRSLPEEFLAGQATATSDQLFVWIGSDTALSEEDDMLRPAPPRSARPMLCEHWLPTSDARISEPLPEGFEEFDKRR